MLEIEQSRSSFYKLDMDCKKPIVLLLGASRGLGAAVTKQIPNDFKIISISRHGIDFQLDFSKSDDQARVLNLVMEINPQRIFYFAGGGPYGLYSNKEWKDHQWALEVSFLFPARLIHCVLKNKILVRQMVFVGSLIAEGRAHPMGVSYGAAKSALKSMIESIVAEEKNNIDLRLFSPGYMDTQMLPKNAHPRREKANLLSPDFVAEKFWQWVNIPDASWYLGVPNE